MKEYRKNLLWEQVIFARKERERERVDRERRGACNSTKSGVNPKKSPPTENSPQLKIVGDDGGLSGSGFRSSG